MVNDNLLEKERLKMVREQLARRDIKNARVLEAMCTVCRHHFVPHEYQYLAYADGPLPIGEGQTISQPYIVALMTQLLQLNGDERVLEVGTGSGYQAAVLGCLAKEVFTIERHEALAKRAKRALKQDGFDNVHVFIGDGSLGLEVHAPYDAIILTAAAPKIPTKVLSQLAHGGRLVCPVGGEFGQQLQLVIRKGNEYSRKKLVPVAFVPLRGEAGWSEKTWYRKRSK